MPNIISGRKPIMEALKAGSPIEKILFLSGVQGKPIDDIKTLAQKRGVKFEHATRQDFRDLSTDAITQGVIALVPSKQFVGIEDIIAVSTRLHEKGFILMLDEIEDPQNLGALVRTAECAGAHGVVIPRHHAASVTAAVVKASAGATEHVPMAEVTNLVSTIEKLKEGGFWIVGLDGAGDKMYSEIDYAVPVVVIVGNEGKGLRRLVKEHCDFVVRIPLYGKIASLNASVAGALVMFEVAGQRRKRPDSQGRTTGGEA